MKKYIFCCILVLFSFSFAFAAPDLPSKMIERIKAAKILLGEADDKPMQEEIRDVKTSASPEGTLQILEAVAAVFHELVREYELADLGAQERLLSKIRINIAYFQLGGADVENFKSDGSLNVLIRRKLRKYLTPELMSDANLFHSLEQ